MTDAARTAGGDRGSVPADTRDSSVSSKWEQSMRQAGAILDHAPDLAHTESNQRRADQARRVPDGADRPHLDEKPKPKLAPKKKREPRSRDKAAAAAGTSGRSTARYGRIAEAAPELAAKVDTGGQVVLKRPSA